MLAKASFAMCHLSGTWQSLCRVPKLTHGKKKSRNLGSDVAAAFAVWLATWHTAKFKCLPCALALAHGKHWFLCRVPWFLHTAKVPDPVFFLLRIWYPK